MRRETRLTLLVVPRLFQALFALIVIAITSYILSTFSRRQIISYLLFVGCWVCFFSLFATKGAFYTTRQPSPATGEEGLPGQEKQDRARVNTALAVIDTVSFLLVLPGATWLTASLALGVTDCRYRQARCRWEWAAAAFLWAMLIALAASVVVGRWEFSEITDPERRAVRLERRRRRAPTSGEPQWIAELEQPSTMAAGELEARDQMIGELQNRNLVPEELDARNQMIRELGAGTVPGELESPVPVVTRNGAAT